MINLAILKMSLDLLDDSIRIAYRKRNFAPSLDERMIHQKQLDHLIKEKQKILIKLENN